MSRKIPKIYNLVGKTFDMLTVLSDSGRRHRGVVLWNCSCACGKSCTKQTEYLTRTRGGWKKSCGCLPRNRYPNLVGRKFNHLKVVAEAGRTKHGGTLWLCLCKCGKKVIKDQHYLIRKNRQQKKSCGCMRFIWRWTPEAKANMSKKMTLPDNQSAKNSALGAYKIVARKRGINWKLADTLFFEMISKDCYYCGAPPSNTFKRKGGSIKYNGVDRLDNSKHYQGGNVVTCCRICNRAKSDLTVEDFLMWARRLQSYQEALV